MSRYLGLVFVCALSSACGDTPFDSLSAAELNSPVAAATLNHPADGSPLQITAEPQCRLYVTAHVRASQGVGTHSTFACEGSPSDFGATR